MLRVKFGILIALFFTFILCFGDETAWVRGELLVQFTHSMTVSEVKNRIVQTDYIDRASTGLLSARMNIWQIVFKDREIDLNQAVQLMKDDFPVALIQRNHYVSQRETIPDDPLFNNQWSLMNTGSGGGIADADIDATDAWDISTGGVNANGDEIVVAIIDSGCELTHPDIAYWKNESEIPNNNLDDDNNGYIDDYDGWNAYTHNGIMQSSSHGTHVAGISSAIGNNGMGVSGVCWNSKVMPICGSSNTEAVVVEAYGYVLEMRARYNESNGVSGAYVVVTNASFGIDYANPVNYPLWSAIYDSLGSVGVLSCGATANANINVDLQYDMPTACPSDYLITVTNTTSSDEKYFSAGYGLTTIDLGAPGTSIRSTDQNGTYSLKTGTSMATPHVSGAVALMCAALPASLLNDYSGNQSGLALLIKNYILAGCDSLSSLQGITVTGGRLNVFKSIQLMRADSLQLNPPRNLTANITDNLILLNWDEPLPDENNVLCGYRVYRNGILLNDTLLLTRQYFDFQAMNETAYDYYVTAVYESGESLPSNDLSIILLKSPVNLTAQVENHTIHLSWQVPGMNRDSRSLLGYNVYRDSVRLNNTLVSEVEFTDVTVVSGETYHYMVTAVYDSGESSYSNVVEVTPMIRNEDSDVPVLKDQLAVYPNPFNPSATVFYQMKESGHVLMEMYNLKGQKVMTLVDQKEAKGQHSFALSVASEKGKPIPSGIYLLKMTINGSEIVTRKLTVLK